MSKHVMLTQEQIKTYSEIYNRFYEYGYDSSLVSIGDQIMKRDQEITAALIQAREEYLSSDREVAAYAVWYMMYHKEIERSKAA